MIVRGYQRARQDPDGENARLLHTMLGNPAVADGTEFVNGNWTLGVNDPHQDDDRDQRHRQSYREQLQHHDAFLEGRVVLRSAFSGCGYGGSAPSL